MAVLSIICDEIKNAKPIIVRSVWASNLESEIKQIGDLIDRYPFVSMDTEFPGVVFRPEPGISHYERKLPSANYLLLKSNVDLLNLIQIGITLSDSEGNLPDMETDCQYIWEFNFKEFDVRQDSHNSDSIELLKRQGIDFAKNREDGIDSLKFAELLMSSGLVCNEYVRWVTFHGAYDFGYLLKTLTQQKLPPDMVEFLAVLKVYFGDMFYDVKYITRFCQNLKGGLDRVAECVGAQRVVGKGHQAGSDSLLTWHAYQKIKELHFPQTQLDKFAGVLYGFSLGTVVCCLFACTCKVHNKLLAYAPAKKPQFPEQEGMQVWYYGLNLPGIES